MTVIQLVLSIELQKSSHIRIIHSATVILTLFSLPLAVSLGYSMGPWSLQYIENVWVAIAQKNIIIMKHRPIVGV